MGQRVKIRRDTSANWATSNPVLTDGEQGYDKTLKQTKTGDGSTAWATLPFNRVDASHVDNLPAAGQTAAQVDAAIVAKGYQTAAQVDTAVVAKGYQTAAQVDSAILAKGYQTAAQIQAYVVDGGNAAG